MNGLLNEISIKADSKLKNEGKSTTKPLLIEDGLFIRNKGSLVKVKWADILWLKGDGNYTTLVTRQQLYSLRNILKEFESVLPAEEFFRIHKSYIVRLDEIVSISPREVIVGTGTVPVGRTYFQYLLDGIKKLSSNGNS